MFQTFACMQVGWTAVEANKTQSFEPAPVAVKEGKEITNKS